MQIDPDELDTVIHRLRRAQGQLGGVIRMLQEGRDCSEVVTQLSAVSKAIDRAGFVMITCALKQAMAEPDGELNMENLEKLFLSLA